MGLRLVVSGGGGVVVDARARLGLGLLLPLALGLLLLLLFRSGERAGLDGKRAENGELASLETTLAPLPRCLNG